MIGPPFTGHYRVLADMPRGLMPFQPGVNTITTAGKPHPTTEQAASVPPVRTETNLELRKNIYDAQGNPADTTGATGTSTGGTTGEQQTNGFPTGEAATGGEATTAAAATGAAVSSTERPVPVKQIRCASCGVDCTRVRFHNTKTKTMDLCSECYLAGQFPVGSVNTEFVKLENPAYNVVRKERAWSDSETLLLLEGVEMFDTDWHAVANHVGTRSVDDCVWHFINLPIEDQYLQQSNSNVASLPSQRIPFSQADNPVLSTLAFLAGSVDASVAAAAAQSSIAEMTKSLKKHMNISDGKSTTGADADKDGAETSAKGKEKEGADKPETPAGETSATPVAPKTEPTGDSMDVDDHSHDHDLAETPHTQHTGAPEETPNRNDLPGSPEEHIAATALGSAAARAYAFSSHEERVAARLVSNAINATLRKLEIKMAQFNELEAVLQAERREIERARQQVFLDRLALKRQAEEVVKQLQEAKAKGGAEGLAIAQAVTRDTMSGPRLVFSENGVIAQPGARPPPATTEGGYVTQEL